MTKHNKLSQEIQNTAQLNNNILTTAKKKQNRSTRHVSLAQNYQNCGLGSALDSAGGAYGTSPDPIAEFQGERKGEGTGRTESKGGGNRGVAPLTQKISALDLPVPLDLTGGYAPDPIIGLAIPALRAS